MKYQARLVFFNPSLLKEVNEADIIKASYEFALKYETYIRHEYMILLDKY